MNESLQYPPKNRASRWRVAGWGAAATLLVLPLIAMQFTDEVNWTGSDFAVFGAMLLVAGAVIELAVRKSRDRPYRLAAVVAVAAAFVLVWVNLAVGIIGSENNPANRMFAGVLVVAVFGAMLARFRSLGMARAMVATAITQILVAAVAIVSDLGPDTAKWPWDLVFLTTFFTSLWLVSARLFRVAALTSPVMQESKR